MNFVIRILVSALGIFLGGRYLSGVKSDNYGTSVVVALVVAFLSVTVGLALKVLTLGILTLGIFALLLDAILLLIADWFLEDFEIQNFWWALGLAAVVAVTDGILLSILL